MSLFYVCWKPSLLPVNPDCGLQPQAIAASDVSHQIVPYVNRLQVHGPSLTMQRGTHGKQWGASEANFMGVHALLWFRAIWRTWDLTNILRGLPSRDCKVSVRDLCACWESKPLIVDLAGMSLILDAQSSYRQIF